ncbi:MAG TPA: hypothetical protein DDZ84_03380 [Firmicutes bacterium]|jgi:wyosine [tRNA(Phe)-imidazoG37] synthetase (radical SAM superfamily)|nr:hypothetical protein [Bacillota bacterium]
MSHILERFSRNYRGKLWVEVMVVKGVNDSQEELERISSALKRVRADKPRPLPVRCRLTIWRG